MEKKKELSFHIAVYFATIISTFTCIYLFYKDYSVPWYLFIALMLVSFVGWFHYLRLVVNSKHIRFDSKVAWFCVVFSFFVVAAPLFFFFVLRKKDENQLK